VFKVQLCPFDDLTGKSVRDSYLADSGSNLVADLYLLVPIEVVGIPYRDFSVKKR